MRFICVGLLLGGLFGCSCASAPSGTTEPGRQTVSEEAPSKTTSETPNAPPRVPVIRHQPENFARLTDEVWRSGQPSRKEFASLARDGGLKSVLNLREYHSDSSEARGTQLELYRLRFAAGKLTHEELYRAMEILRDAPKPVLIHCMHGSDRTGAVAATYRMVFQGWTADKAVAEMRDGFGFHESYYRNLVPLLQSLDAAAFRSRLGVKVAERPDMED